MKNQLNREFVEELNQSNNQGFAEKLNNIIFGVVENALTELSEKSPFVKKEHCVLIPVDETFLGSFCQLSQYTYILGIDNPQIAFNSKKRRNWWSYVWREFKASWRIGRKKKYKKRENVNTPVPFDKYRISDFKHDLMNRIANNISDTSVVYEYPFNLMIIGNDDFGLGVKVLIYVCYFEGKTNTFKLYNAPKNKFIDVNFGKRFENLNAKIKMCGQSFVDIVKLFNTVFSKKYNRIPNQVLVESMIYSCPDTLFDDKDIYKTFVNIANYVRVMDSSSFVSICDEQKPLFEDKIIKIAKCQTDYGRIIAMLDNFKY